MSQVQDRLDARARQLKAAGDPRNLGELRVQALRDAVLGEDTGGWPQVRVDVTIDLAAYLGLTRTPGELSGYGPITAEAAREIGRDAQLRRLVTDPITGTVIDVGRRRYRPTKRQHDIVKAVDPIDGLIEPLPDDDDIPEPVANRIPYTDSDPPWAIDNDGIPLPDPPPLHDQELEDFEYQLDLLRCFGRHFIDFANEHYDQARALGLIA
jgi:hypothetical protein